MESCDFGPLAFVIKNNVLPLDIGIKAQMLIAITVQIQKCWVTHLKK